MATPAAVLQVLVTANTAAATASLTKFNTQLKGTEAQATKSAAATSRFGSAARTVGTIGAGVLAYGLYKGVKAGVDFEKQMDSVAAVSQASHREMKELNKQALKLGQSTAFSASEVATAQEELAKGGLKVKQILSGALPAALKLAAAGQLELGDAASTTVNAMKLFGMRGKDATKVANMLATAANTTTADVSDFAAALQQGGSAAKQAGYDMNDTVTVLEALAEAGIKNSDAGTSMKTAFLQLLAPTAKQAELAKQLGISWTDQNGNLKDAAGLSQELQGALDGMSNSQQAANLKVLAGTDGFRTLAALYDAGPSKLDKLTAANEKNGTAQEIAKEKMDNTAGSLEQLQGAFETLSIKLYQGKAGMFRDIIDGATDTLTEFTDIVTSKKLTNDEKVSEVMQLISDKIKDAIPRVANAAFKVGTAITKGIARAFIEGNIVTKLFIGAALFKMFGGAAVLKDAGTKLGTKMGKGLPGGIATGFAVGALAILLAPDAYRLGKKLGEKVGEGIRDEVKDAREWVNNFLDALPQWMTGRTETPWGKLKDSDVKPLKVAVELMKDLGNPTEAATALMDNFGIKSKKAWGLVQDAITRMEKKSNETFPNLGKALDKTKDKTEDGGGAWTNYSKKAADSAQKTNDKMGKMSTNVVNSYGNMANGSSDGLKTLSDNTNKALEAMGVKQAIKFSIKLAKKATNQVRGLQTGGVIVPGQGDGDKVPALLEPGEVVLNKKAVAAMGGASRANSINQKIPRFATGGVIQQALGPYSIPPIAYDPNHAGGNSHLHLDFYTKAQALSYGHKMQGMGWTIGEYTGSNPYGFGPVTTQHQSPGHYDGTGFDANTPQDETKSQVQAVARLLNGGKLAGAVAEKIARVLLKGPDGPLKNIGQGALDKVRSAANKYLSSHGGGERGAGGPMLKGLPDALQKYNHVYAQSSGFGDGYAMPFNAVAALAEWAGAPGVSMARTAIGESQLEPGAVGFDPGGTRGLGLWMITTGFNDALINKLGGESQMRNPILNAQAMNTIFDSQGIGAWYSQTADSSNSHYNGPLLRQMGGIIPKFAKGTKGAKGVKGPSGGRGQLNIPAHDHGLAHVNTTNMQPLVRAKQMWDKLNALAGPDAQGGKIAYVDELIQVAEDLANQDDFLSTIELTKQLDLNKELLDDLKLAAKWAHKGVSFTTTAMGKNPKLRKRLSGLRKNFKEVELATTGITGTGGRLLEQQIKYDALKGTNTGTVASMDISQLRSVIEASRYGVFDGAFAKGGSISPGHWGIAGEAGPEVVRGPATVHPMGGGVNVTNNFDWEGMDLYVETTVNGVIAKRERVGHTRARQYTG